MQSGPIEAGGRLMSAVQTSRPSLRPTVLYFCRLGDMIMLIPLLNLLHRRYGLPCQVVGTGSWTDTVYGSHPDVQGVWSLHRHLPFIFDPAWRKVRRALRESHPGPIYVPERHYRHLPRIRRILKSSGVDPRRCVFITDEPIIDPEHLVDRFVALGTRTPPLVQACDYPVPALATIEGPRLHVAHSEVDELNDWLEARGWLGRELILVQPGNHRSMGPRRGRWRRLDTDDKSWPVERWVQLLRLIHGRKSQALIMLRGAPEEVSLLEEIKAAAALDAVIVDGHGLRRFFALCTVAHSLISVDTGPAHAAAALNLPVVVLYGAQPPQFWLPRSPSGSAVYGVGGAPAYKRADEVPVEMVFDAWLRLIEAPGPARQC